MAANPSTQRKSKSKSGQQRKPPRQLYQQRVQQLDRSVWLFICLVRLLICGLGASAISGTVISVVNPHKQQLATTVTPPPPIPQPKPASIELLKLTQSSRSLTDKLQAVSQKNSKLDPSFIFVEIDSGEYSELGADRVLPAASTIKLPILIALFQDVDAQKVKLEEQLTIDKQSIAGEAGDLQAQKPGTQVSILVAATKMMTISDNTATNLIIKRLGGAAALNQRFRDWGLQVTKIHNSLPDLEGTNVTTARDLARAIAAIVGGASPAENRGKIVSDASRSQMLSMMSHTARNTMLPQGLGAGAKIAHKTGDIGSTIADVGTIELPTGKKYIAAVLVNRPYNDPAGPRLVRQMSKLAYDHFQQNSSTSQFQPKVNPGFPSTIFIKKKEEN
jgi:beta-lactamase class A